MKVQEALTKLKQACKFGTAEWNAVLAQLAQDPAISHFIALVKKAEIKHHLSNVQALELRWINQEVILERLADPSVLAHSDLDAAVRFVLAAEKVGMEIDRNLGHGTLDAYWEEMLRLPEIVQHRHPDRAIVAFVRLQSFRKTLEQKTETKDFLEILEKQKVRIFENEFPERMVRAIMMWCAHEDSVFRTNPILLEKLTLAASKIACDFTIFNFGSLSGQRIEELLDKMIAHPDPQQLGHAFQLLTQGTNKIPLLLWNGLEIQVLCDSAYPVEMADFLSRMSTSALFDYVPKSTTEYNENLKNLMKYEHVLFGSSHKQYPFLFSKKEEFNALGSFQLHGDNNHVAVIRESRIKRLPVKYKTANVLEDLEYQQEVIDAILDIGEPLSLHGKEHVFLTTFLHSKFGGDFNFKGAQEVLDNIFKICKQTGISEQEKKINLAVFCLSDKKVLYQILEMEHERLASDKDLAQYFLPTVYEIMKNRPYVRHGFANDVYLLKNCVNILLNNLEDPVAFQKLKDLFSDSDIENDWGAHPEALTQRIIALENTDIIDAWLNLPGIASYVSEHPEWNTIFDAFVERKMCVFQQTPDLVLNDRSAETYSFIVERLCAQNTVGSIRHLETLMRRPGFIARMFEDFVIAGRLFTSFSAARVRNPSLGVLMGQIPEMEDFLQHMALWEEERAEEEQPNLQNLARDQESSMHVVTAATKAYLQTAADHYGPMINEQGSENVFYGLKEAIKERYEENPAFIFTDHGEKVFLPLEWDPFQDMTLTADEKERALKAYYRDKNHSALRYLMEYNHWMDPDATFRSADHRSNYEYFKPEILIRWMAAKDPTIGVVDGFDIPDRIDALIAELALMARAHNWDKKRVQRSYKGNEYVFLAMGQENPTGLEPIYLDVRKDRLVYSVLDAQGEPLPWVWTDIPMTHTELERELQEPIEPVVTPFKRKLFTITNAHGHTQGTEDPAGRVENCEDWGPDKPTCIPGAEGRLSQATLGHPLFMQLTKEILNQAMNEAMKDHFKEVLAGRDPKEVKDALDDIVLNLGEGEQTSIDIINTFNLDDVHIAALIETVKARYPNANPALFVVAESSFKDPMYPNHAMAFYEAFKAALETSPSVMPVTSASVSTTTSPVSFSGSESPSSQVSRPESPRSGATPNYNVRDAGPLGAFERQQGGRNSPGSTR